MGVLAVDSAFCGNHPGLRPPMRPTVASLFRAETTTPAYGHPSLKGGELYGIFASFSTLHSHRCRLLFFIQNNFLHILFIIKNTFFMKENDFLGESPLLVL